MPTARVAGCESKAGCCTPFCDTAAPDCPDGAECQPWTLFEAPKGLETLGVCADPAA